jgi:hypothetical protein
MEIIHKITQKIKSKIKSIDPFVFILWGLLLISYGGFNLIILMLAFHEIDNFYITQILISIFGLIIFNIGFKGRKMN